MESSASTRLLRACKEGGRPLPQFSPDDVVDFQVVEAITLKAAEEQRKANEAEKAKAQRESTGLAGHRDQSFLERARAQE